MAWKVAQSKWAVAWKVAPSNRAALVSKGRRRSLGRTGRCTPRTSRPIERASFWKVALSNRAPNPLRVAPLSQAFCR
jgi:hypothetical protein